MFRVDSVDRLQIKVVAHGSFRITLFLPTPASAGHFAESQLNCPMSGPLDYVGRTKVVGLLI